MAMTRYFRIPKKIAQHFVIGSISIGATQALDDLLSDDSKDNPWITFVMFVPALMTMRALYEILLLSTYKREPLQRLINITHLGKSQLLVKLLQRMMFKTAFSSPTIVISVLDAQNVFSINDRFFRNMIYGFSSHILSVIGEAISDYYSGSFFSGAYTANHIAAQINFSHRGMVISEGDIAELASTAFISDAGTTWYQFILRAFDNVVVAISIAEIFLYNIFKEYDVTKEIQDEPYVFITFATFAIFFTNWFAKWAFSPDETPVAAAAEPLIEEDCEDNATDNLQHVDETAKSISEPEERHNEERVDDYRSRLHEKLLDDFSTSDIRSSTRVILDSNNSFFKKSNRFKSSSDSASRDHYVKVDRRVL